MAKPFKEMRRLMHEFEFTNETLGEALGISATTVSTKLNAHYPWTSAEMWKFMELTQQPAHRLHEVFPPGGINEPGVQRRLARR